MGSKRAEANFITVDPHLTAVLAMADKIAKSDIPCLIQGESGTGKEVLVKRIHASSLRASKPLITVNCGAIQETLILSELFGHEKGAFTGATHQKPGLVETANGGTLFLDEIAELGFEVQSKLLRFLQEGESFRIRGKAPIKLNVRVLSATNKDPLERIKAGLFREDLYYRINTVTLNLTPLRKRPGDIEPLLSAFLKGGAPSDIKGFTSDAIEKLKSYPWPGNVRELQNAVERFKILCDPPLVTVDDVKKHLNFGQEAARQPETFDLSLLEKHHIFHVLSHFEGNKTKAAQAMGITVKTLYNKLARYQSERGQSLN
jgi:transcriptional regulator with PAS, ATPase and Fis domain